MNRLRRTSDGPSTHGGGGEKSRIVNCLHSGRMAAGVADRMKLDRARVLNALSGAMTSPSVSSKKGFA